MSFRGAEGVSWNYETIKQLAKEAGVPVADLFALAPQNDPFYANSPTQRAMAEWFARIWRERGYGDGIHLRRIHYQLVSMDPPIQTHKGVVYENMAKHWEYLLRASKYARYLELVPAGAFVDRRNPDPHIFAEYWDNTPGYWWDASYSFGLEFPEFPDMPKAQIFGYDGNLQGYLVELWCEKSTMNDVLEPICRDCQANLITGLGEMSITSVLELIKRVRRLDRPCRILYISDFDPAGAGMPISVARKVEYEIYRRAVGLDIVLQPVVMTLEQVREYDLPTSPIQPSEARRKAFMERFGVDGAVELDALEALYPGELARIITEAIERYYDHDVADRAREQRNNLADRLREVRDEKLADVAEEWAVLRVEYQEVVDSVSPLLAQITEQLEEIGGRARTLLGEIKIDAEIEYPLPEPEPADEFNGMLYDSGRGYVEQLEWYERYRGDSGTERRGR